MPRTDDADSSHGEMNLVIAPRQAYNKPKKTIRHERHTFVKERTMKGTQMTFEELCLLLQEKEKQFGMSSVEFFIRYNTGRLGDARETIEWAGLYRIYLKLCLAQLPSETAPQVAVA